MPPAAREQRGGTPVFVLRERPSYGRALATETEQLASTVYKALKRLESLGLVRSRWETPRAPRDHPPRRVYTLTAKGRREHAKLT